MICKLIQSNKHIPLHPLGGCNKYKKKNVNQIFSESISHWQLIPPCFDPVSPSTDQYNLKLTQYYQVTISAALQRPSTIKHPSVPPNTDPVPPITKRYLKEYHLPDLLSTWRHMNSHQGSSLTRATCHFFYKFRILRHCPLRNGHTKKVCGRQFSLS